MTSRRCLLAAASLLVPVAAAGPAGATHHLADPVPTTVCVGPAKGCSATLTAALAAAKDGDTVKLGPGTYPGGILIDASITLEGAGADQTTISGGGPVITVGAPLAPTPPTVTIKGITVTGGVTTRAPAEYGLQHPGALALGGGILAPYGPDFTPGADLTLVDTVIRGNRSTPEEAFLVPKRFLKCPGEGCYFGGGYGGGINSNGPLTLIRTTVVDNQTGSFGPRAEDQTSDAASAGIDADRGPLNITDSRIADNSAIATGPYSRFAEGAGIKTYETVEATITGSEITGNRAVLRSAYPSYVEQLALGGGFFISSNEAHATVTDSVIADNSTRATSSRGYVQAWSGGLQVNGTIDVHGSRISGNSSSAGSADGHHDAYAESGGAEVNGDFGDVSTLSDTLIVDNTARAVSGRGEATVAGGAMVAAPYAPGSDALEGSLVAGNRAIARSRGTASVYGAGIWNLGIMDLRDTSVYDNTGSVTGRDGEALGGGLYDGLIYVEDPLLIAQLSLTDSDVVSNQLRITGGATASGGGIFSDTPVSRTRSSVVLNEPDPQCQGCDSPATMSPAPPASVLAHRERAQAALRLDFWALLRTDQD